MLERLLYRLSLSAHRDRFILKGAMLFVTWVADPFRPTRDLDLLGHGESSPKAIAETFHAICMQPVEDDGVVFDVDGLEAAPIREEVEYGGVRVRTTATIAGARIPIQVDIGFGDAVTPGPVDIEYPSLLDAPAPRLRAYPVIAEKFEALVTLGMANSRLKDFYDLWLITETFELERSTLAEAVRQTFARRGTDFPKERPMGLSDAYAEAWDRQWRTFLGRERMTAAPPGLATVVADLGRFLLPLTWALEGNWLWKPRSGWTQA
ncbi:nucleotidyl transferase AbiEii/AbiGii toxin family protein [Rhizobium sullae]|uniref:nucleotidyl transferase AbiEii/AbiGii toxin family protein n=1 Tax=Rhizobium sullae TaxID=50338 RepID=UPI00040770BE|nr:nucleotidyl transferase AbiEii/AbiGii toxin family protein [Rhizobium sullae]